MPEHEEHKWDFAIDTMRDMILAMDEDNPQKQIFLEQLNQAINQLTLQPLVPAEQTAYLIWWVEFNCSIC